MLRENGRVRPLYPVPLPRGANHPGDWWMGGAWGGGWDGIVVRCTLQNTRRIIGGVQKSPKSKFPPTNMSLSCFDGFITISTRWIHWFCSFFRDVPQNACNTRLGKKNTHKKKNRLTRNQWNFVENHSTRTMKIAHVGINLLRVDDHLSRHSSQNNGPENRLCRRKIRLTRDLWTDFWMNNVQVEKKEKRLLHKK